MGRSRLTTTKPFPTIRVWKAKVPVFTHYITIGCYSPKTSTIRLRWPRWLTTFKCQGKKYARDDPADYMGGLLLHEITHWAQYLFLTRDDWMTKPAEARLPHDQRLIEKMASEIEALWIPIRED